jgi:acyl carrier protein
LIKCFSAVFPELSEKDIREASLTSVPGWDSVATINLLAVIEEEFSIEIDPQDLGHLVSFKLILDYLRNQNGIA